MNKLIDNLFEKDLVIKIVSVLTAILIWFLVLDQDNPFEERTIAVPLTSNVEVLQQNNLQIVGTPLPTSIDVRIRGRRQKIAGVTANDFKAVIDLSEVTESGKKRIKIDMPQYLGEQDILISGINPTSVNLNFEKIVGKQYPVSVEYTGKLPPGYELVNVKVDPSNVILQEKESSISQVSKVVAQINLDNIKDSNEIVLRGMVLDSEGKVLKQFEGQVPIIVSFELVKRVPVSVTTKGEPAADWFFKEIKYTLSEVRVSGTRTVLDGITRLVADPIDISGQTGTIKAPLSIALPKGAALLKEDADALMAEVILDRLITRNVNVSANTITIHQVDTTGTKKYSIVEDTIPITIKGKPDNVNAVKASDFKLSIQVENLEEGTHEVPLNVQYPNTVSLVGEYSVKVLIEKTNEEQPAAGALTGLVYRP
jgi:YbbR domain-containing protein